MNTATARIAELVGRFGAADACPARLLGLPLQIVDLANASRYYVL